jgi:transposase
MTTDERAASLSHDEVVSLLVAHDALVAQHRELSVEFAELKRQVAWFQRQLFGTKSERRVMDPEGKQLFLAAYQRRTTRPQTDETDTPLRFDPSVPVEEIRVPAPEGVTPETHERVSEKTTERLAQRPASYVVLRYVREVWKRKADGQLLGAPAPAAVLERSLADVSLLAGLVIDKFQYHLPLYRQHQRMAAAGVHVTRATLTNWVHGTAALLEPIYTAQLAAILSGSMITMDETPIRAGRDRPGTMHRGYFWPIYGDRDEVAFPFSRSRSKAFVVATLKGFGGRLLTDGYEVYARYAERVNGLTHALCWSHSRRKFEAAMEAEPALCGEALERIGRLYTEEAALDRKTDPPEKRLEHRAEQSKPIVDAFFVWLKETVERQVLLPTHPFLKAARYALEREVGLRVFLEYPDVPIDTNHLEREIRPIALGRRNWLFCWTEIGAHHVGVVQSLIATCRLHEIPPYTYLVDVLQRIDTHPASRVHELTPRLWKERFAADPLRSDLDRLARQ